MTGQYVGAVDQGTTGTRFMVFDREGRAVADAYRTHEQHYPEPGWVEHDPGEILDDVRAVAREALAQADLDPSALAALGVANQRETTVVWEAETGEPVHRAIVWQDRRTTDRVEALRAAGKTEAIQAKTGLEPDAYFSATKLEWLLDEVPGLRERARAGEVLFGTVDAWLVASLAGEHVTDATNASRTMLFDVHDLAWDDDLLAEFGVPREMLPEVRPSSAVYGRTDPEAFLGAELPVAAALGDQQAALFGQACFETGEAKATTGTGSFLLLNTGTEPVESEHGLLTTVAYLPADGPARYALEGSIFVTGGAVGWLADVDLVGEPADSERVARRVDGTDGVYVVPAFQGLGAPYWDGRARGTVVGLTRGTRRAHLVRATVESVAYRTRDVVEAMAADAGLSLDALRVDGGAVSNDLLCQVTADVLGVPVDRPAQRETTALGAAAAAGLAVGLWADREELRAMRRTERTFEPALDAGEADRRYDRWLDAVERARGWARTE